MFSCKTKHQSHGMRGRGMEPIVLVEPLRIFIKGVDQERPYARSVRDRDRPFYRIL